MNFDGHEPKQSTHEKWQTFFARLFMASLLAMLIHYFNLDYIEAYLYDLRVWFRPAPPVSSQIETVFIENSTVENLKEQPHYEHHQKFLENLLKDDPLAIVYVPNPRDIDGTHEQKLAFVETVKKFRNFFYVTKETVLKGEEGKLDFTDVFRPIKVVSGPITTDSTLLAKDGVTRRMMLYYQGQTLLHPQLVQLMNPDRDPHKKPRGTFEFYGSEQAYVDMNPSGSYSRWTFSQIYNDKFPLGRFKNKVVFVGLDLGISTYEYVMTSYSRKVTAMTAVEAHANMLDTLVRDSAPVMVPHWLNVIVSFLISVITIYVVLAMSPVKGLIVLALMLVVFLMVGFILFWPFGLWIDMSHPLITIFFSYYFFIPYRLIVENRRSWELLEKNKLLTQVEELKNNFISMMSHDLKTPLARIHGMADIIGKDKKVELSPEQSEALKSIQQSSDDLVNFISSILNFSRIESQGVKLNIKSKDINAIVEDVLQKYEFMAEQKKIKFVKELEPLFSLRMDPDLIRQVVSNLIENAIKYSPEGAKILIKSEESQEKVILKVVDEGMGISDEEIPNIFMKFFRSKNAKISPIKGSGLGLYLAKYFVELHKGTINVESTVGKGSSFIVELPIHAKI
jgi:signal transduction histidine kinase